jgi:cysteinyl-tRNA synthetase
MPLHLYNTLSRSQEEFVPIDPTGERVLFYSCGPTVYDYSHVGNFRAFLNADVLRRTLEFLGYEVRHVMNITDVGHMTEDANPDGGGEDKMELASRRLLEAKKSGALPEGVDIDPNDPWAIANFYADAFIEDARRLGMKVVADAVAEPELLPRPTQYIEQMITLIEGLIESDHAYVADDGVVYFSVDSFPDYGRLSGNTLDALRSGEGGRVDMSTQAVKRNPADFMLWKPDPSHTMKWDSPWGEGYPGWHLECSVMASSLLGTETGDQIDLHSGGEDNIFPHHECEIAQSRCASGSPSFARYWFHTRHLMVEGGKMSKSLGNFFTIRDLMDRGVSPAAIRLELIKTHYRVNSNFTLQGLKDSQRQVDRWHKAHDWLGEHAAESRPAPGPLVEGLNRFETAISSDLNIAGAMGVLNEAISALPMQSESSLDGGGDGTWAEDLAALERMDVVLGVLELESSGGGGVVDEVAILAAIEARKMARDAKDWAGADRIRDELLEMGIAIKDGAQGTTWSQVLE